MQCVAVERGMNAAGCDVGWRTAWARAGIGLCVVFAHMLAMGPGRGMDIGQARGPPASRGLGAAAVWAVCQCAPLNLRGLVVGFGEFFVGGCTKLDQRCFVIAHQVQAPEEGEAEEALRSEVSADFPAFLQQCNP